MTEATENQDSRHTQTSPVFSRRVISKMSLLKRVLVILLLAYFIWILTFAWSWGVNWSIDFGVHWTSGGPGTLFPIPSPPGNLTVITPAHPIDTLLYLIFMHNGLWILWMSLTLLFVISPYRINFHTLFSLLLSKKRNRD